MPTRPKIKMVVDGKRTRRMKAFHEEDVYDSRKAAMDELRRELGWIYGQTDEDYLESLKTVGVTVTFEEI